MLTCAIPMTHNTDRPGAIELPGCLSGDGCKEWDAGVATTGAGVVENVTVENVRMSDAVKRVRRISFFKKTNKTLPHRQLN